MPRPSALESFRILAISESLPGTIEWIVKGLPYVIVHEIDPDREEVLILGIYHGAQDRAE